MEMKSSLYFVFVLSLLFSCAVPNEAIEGTGTPLPEKDPNIIVDDPLIPVDKAGRPMNQAETIDLVAVVRIDKKGCPFYLEVIEGDLYFTAYAVNFPDNLKKEGKRVKFEYAPSKGPSPEGCSASKVISVSNLSEITD